MIVILGLPRDSFAYSYTNENLEIFQEGPGGKLKFSFLVGIFSDFPWVNLFMILL